MLLFDIEETVISFSLFIIPSRESFVIGETDSDVFLLSSGGRGLILLGIFLVLGVLIY